MSPVTATTRCMCISSASCWALVTQLWENGVLTPTASLQMNEMQMQPPPPPCHLLPSYSVMPICTPPSFQVRSVPCWAPLPLGRGDLQSWLTLLCCCRWRGKLRSPLDPYSQGGVRLQGSRVPTSTTSHFLIVSLLPDDRGGSFLCWTPLTIPWQGNQRVGGVKNTSLLGPNESCQWETGTIFPLVFVWSKTGIAKMFSILLSSPFSQFSG